MINKIIAETGVKIDIEDDGRVSLATADDAAAALAKQRIMDKMCIRDRFRMRRASP